jgi:hypothetical protein
VEKLMDNTPVESHGGVVRVNVTVAWDLNAKSKANRKSNDDFILGVLGVKK